MSLKLLGALIVGATMLGRRYMSNKNELAKAMTIQDFLRQ